MMMLRSLAVVVPDVPTEEVNAAAVELVRELVVAVVAAVLLLLVWCCWSQAA